METAVQTPVPLAKKEKRIQRFKKFISFLFILSGLCLLAYPWISNYVNQHQAENLVDAYTEQVDNSDELLKKSLLNEARSYNKTLLDNQVKLTEPFEESVIDTRPYVYEKMLSINGNPIMGSVRIPTINVYLPIYHGTTADVLEKGVGHLKGSSLPIGGKDTHSVLTGHTGLTNAKLFTDLTEVKKGDLFVLEVMGIKIAYKVIDIYVVEPSDTEKLKVVEGKDYCTLVTCTPYGVNSHRLLVRGERTKYNEDAINNQKHFNPVDSLWMRSYAIAVIIGLCITLFLLLLLIIFKKRKKRRLKKQMMAKQQENNSPKTVNNDSSSEKKQ